MLSETKTITMTLNASISQQKFVEKLIILNDRGTGILTRIYNIKKACQNAKSKPSFLSEKSLESTIKNIVKKFPASDTKNTHAISNMRVEIMRSLSLYYYTFVDLLDFKDAVCELLTTIDAYQLNLDITLNFELTQSYLELVTTYALVVMLLSRVEDRKAVLGMFNSCYELVSGHCEASFPRLGQMIVDFDNPLRRLAEQFHTHSRVLLSALQSLCGVFPRRNLSEEHWREGRMLSITANSSQMLNPAQTDTMACEYLSLETLERWIVVSCVLCHQHLASRQPVVDLLTNVLQSCWVITLFRDEVIFVHQFLQSFFESMKGYGKRMAEVKECCTQAMTQSPRMHRDRRKFLRSALHELTLILHDQPGLLGPKALFVWMALCFARDEVGWLLRHADNVPQRWRQKLADLLVDRQLPELLFLMEVLRALVRKYQQVIQRYYVQYLAGYDATALSLALQQLQACSEEESVILSSVNACIGGLHVRQVEEAALFDLRALRLDLFRLQGYTSSTGVERGSLRLLDNRELAQLLGTITFHTKMVDYLDAMLDETSDLSIYCFYPNQLSEHFKMCLEFPAQNRFIVCFPLVCGHFQNCTHELCPEERHHIRERSLSVVNMFLDEMAKEAKNIITAICDEQCALSDKLLAKHCARAIADSAQRKKKNKRKKRQHQQQDQQEADGRPGLESVRRVREDLTLMDKLHMALSELCFAINYCSTIHVWEYTFAPREYLYQHLETRFARAVVGMAMYEPDTQEIAKPSELLASLRSYIFILQSVESLVSVDMTRVFNSVLLQQTQVKDSAGEPTLATLYSRWYADMLTRHSSGAVCFVEAQRVFVTLQTEASVQVAVEEYTDMSELRALAELLGAYGMRALSDLLVDRVVALTAELRALVSDNRELLIALRTNFDKPDTMRELSRKLSPAAVDALLQKMISIGVVLTFRLLCDQALHAVLDRRVPFLVSAIEDLQNSSSHQEEEQEERQRVVAEMSAAAGLHTPVDTLLVSSLRQKLPLDSPEEQYLLSCLLMVFVATGLPRLARCELTRLHLSQNACLNNAHCLAVAVNSVFGALFVLSGHDDVEERLKEFLALASSSLLRLASDTDREALREKDSTFLLLNAIVEQSPLLSMDLLESCFPFILLRSAYSAINREDQAASS